MTLRVLVVDDQALVQRGFALVLAHAGDIEVVAEAGNGLEAVAAARDHRPDLAALRSGLVWPAADRQMAGTNCAAALRPAPACGVLSAACG